MASRHPIALKRQWLIGLLFRQSPQPIKARPRPWRTRTVATLFVVGSFPDGRARRGGGAGHSRPLGTRGRPVVCAKAHLFCVVRVPFRPPARPSPPPSPPPFFKGGGVSRRPSVSPLQVCRVMPQGAGRGLSLRDAPRPSPRGGRSAPWFPRHAANMLLVWYHVHVDITPVSLPSSGAVPVLCVIHTKKVL